MSDKPSPTPQVDALDEILLSYGRWVSDSSGLKFSEAKAKLSAREVAVRIDELTTTVNFLRNEEDSAYIGQYRDDRIAELEKLQGGR